MSKSAFTLIELIVVMAVIGILVLLAAPKFLGYTQRAQETKHIHTAKVIETALEAYLINGGAFPADLEVADKTMLEESAGKETLIGVNGYVTTIDEETYYELTYDFIQKLDVKLSAKNELLVEALASSVPTAVYTSENGITLVDKVKTMKGYILKVGELPNEIIAEGVKQIAAGELHTLALMKDGTVRAWGGNGYGQLGLGDTNNVYEPATIPGLTGVVKVSAGYNHSFAIMGDGKVKGWGLNENGQLGVGDVNNRYSPELIGNLDGVTDIAAGYYHTIALLEDKTLKSWGMNNNGQLGDGTLTQKTTPSAVKSITNVMKVTSKGHHSLALTESGAVLAWGWNGFGQLGDNTKESRNIPKITSIQNEAIDIATGGAFSMALLQNGTVRTWGQNNHGQLGIGTTVDKLMPVSIPSLSGIKSISSESSSAYAILENGGVKSWGLSGYGTDSYIPVDVSDVAGATSISAGYFHLFIATSNDIILGLGRNDLGQLSDGSRIHRLIPTLITID